MSNQCSESFKGFDLSIFDHFCLHLDMPSTSYGIIFFGCIHCVRLNKLWRYSDLRSFESKCFISPKQMGARLGGKVPAAFRLSKNVLQTTTQNPRKSMEKSTKEWHQAKAAYPMLLTESGLWPKVLRPPNAGVSG